jgi:hypothetical protein
MKKTRYAYPRSSAPSAVEILLFPERRMAEERMKICGGQRYASPSRALVGSLP